MKTPSILVRSIASLLGLAAAASAQTVYTWDADPLTPGIQGGSGTWNLVNQNWVNAGVNSAWLNAPIGSATFGFGAAGNITVGNVTVDDLIFDETYTLSGGTLTFTTGSTITANADALIASSIVATSAITKEGVGTLALSGSGISYTGGTLINTGTVRLQNATGFRSNTTVGAGAALEVNNAIAVVVGTSHSIGGSGTVVKSGAGKWDVGSASGGVSFTLGAGALVDIQGGTIQNNFTRSSWVSNLASMNIASGAMFDIYAENVQLDGLNGNGTLQNGFAGLGVKTVTLGAAGGNGSYFGALQNGAGGVAVTKTGLGTQLLAGNGITYTNTTTVNQGFLTLSDTRFSGGAKTVAAGATLEINSNIPFVTRWVNGGTISGAGTIVKTGSGVFAPTGSVTFSGTIEIFDGRLHNDNVTSNWTGSTANVIVHSPGVLDLRANDIIVDRLSGDGEVWNSHPAGNGDTLIVGVANGTSTFDGVIRGDGSQAADNPDAAVTSLTKTGTGTFTLTNQSTYRGATTVNGGILRIENASDRLPAASLLVVNGGATAGGIFDLNGLSQNVANISGGAGTVRGLITNSQATQSVLTLSGTTLNSFDGVIQNGAGTVSVIRAAGGTTSFTGPNTFTGPTIVTGGALRLSGLTVPTNSNVQLDGGVIEAGAGDFSPIVGVGGGQVQWLGSGGFSAAGATRNINVGGAGGTLLWGSAGFVPDGSSFIFGGPHGDSTARLLNPINLTGGDRRITAVNGPAAIEGELAGNITNGNLFFAPANASIAVTGQILAPVVVENAVTASTNLMSVRLNRVTGDAIVGGLQIGVPTATSGQFSTVSLGANEQIGNSGVITFGSPSGAWSYLNLFGFNETVAGVSSLPGQDGGVIQLVEADASPATDSTLTLQVASGTQSFFGHIRDRSSGASNHPTAGKLNLVKEGAGTQELTTWNGQVWTGSTSVNAGTLRIALAGFTGGNATLSSPTTIATSATLDFTNAPNGNMWTYGGALSGNGALVKSGRGIVAMTGPALANTGSTTITDGVLRLIDTALPGAVTVNAGAYLEEFRTGGSGTLTGTFSGPGGFIKNGHGETIVASPLATAQTVVRRGSLTMGADNVLPSSGVVAVSGQLVPTLKLNGTVQTVAGIAASRDVNSRIVGGSGITSALTVNVGAGAQSTFGGHIGGTDFEENNLGLVKSGAGTLVLNGTASYTGVTLITAGTIQLGGSTTMPVNLANLGIWLDGADPEGDGSAPADGSAISVWKNKGTLGAAGDFSAQPGFEPSFGASGAGLINGHSTIRFTAQPVAGFAAQAEYDKLTNPINLAGGPSTIIVAGRYGGASADERKRLVSAITNNWLLGWWNNGENTAFYQNGFAPTITAGTTNGHVYSSVLRGDGIGETYGEIGKLGSLDNAVGPIGIALGGGANYVTPNTENSTGDLGEVIIVPGILADADRAAIEAYLTRKWTGYVPTNPLPTTGSVILSSAAATLAINGATQTVGSVTGIPGSSITLGGGKFITGNSGSDATFNGVISGPGTVGKVGFGTWTLTAAQTYQGPTRIQGGTLELSGGANRLPVTTTVELGDDVGTGVLRLNGNSQTIAGLSTPTTAAALVSHVVNGSATPVTLTVNLASGLNTYGGVIGGPGADENNLVLRKEGIGTLALTNTSTHTGGTNIAGGVIRLGGPRTLPTSAAIWLDATDGATVNTSFAGVTSWTNKGTLAAAGDFAAVSGQEPIFVGSEPAINGQPVVHFEANFGGGAPYDRLTNALDFSGGSVTVAYLGRLSGTSNQRLLSATGNNWLLGSWSGSAESAYFNQGFLHNSGTADTSPRLHVAVIPAGGVSSYYSNGALKGQGAGVGPNGLSLGGGFLGGDENSSGDIGELLVFTSALSDADRQALEAYFARKWFGIGAANLLPSSGAVNLTAAGATLDVNGVTQTIGALSGVAGSSILLNEGSLVVGDASDTTFAGEIVGVGAFTKAGSGELTLTGPLSMTTLTGSDGVLNVGSDAVDANVVAEATVNFGVSQTLASLDIADGGVVTLDAAFAPPAPASVQAVPEPGAVSLLIAGVASVLGFRRSRRADSNFR